MTKAREFDEVPKEMLRWSCPPEYLPFETSDEIEPSKEIIGQKRAVEAVIRSSLGPSRRRMFAGVFAGDIVPFKKPDPAIYRLASSELGIPPSACLVVEDSRNGLLAATAAGMPCVVTTSAYTRDEEFPEARAVYADLGDPPGSHVTLGDLLEAGGIQENAGP